MTLAAKSQSRIVRGRVVELTQDPLGRVSLVLQHRGGIERIVLSDAKDITRGDWVECDSLRGELIRFVKNAREDHATPFADALLDSRRLQNLHVRAEVERGIREFFLQRGYLEVRTPLLVPCPGMEAHLRPFEVRSFGTIGRSAFLPTSPEFSMKRLLIGGLERIFQITPAFRSEPFALTHLPEFTMLEWYSVGASYLELMAELEELIHSLIPAASRLLGSAAHLAPLKKPFEQRSVKELFADYLGVHFHHETTIDELRAWCERFDLPYHPEMEWEDLHQKIWGNLIELKLGQTSPCFVYGYHPRHAAWAEIEETPDGERLAKRFELYAGGMELCNAFEELRDAKEQAARFEAQMSERRRTHPDFPPTPADEDFLSAMREGLPPCSGAALGVDRLVMLLADERDIRLVNWLDPFAGEEGSG